MMQRGTMRKTLTTSLVTLLSVVLIGCSQVASGRWYDTEKGQSAHWWQNESGKSTSQKAPAQGQIRGYVTVRKGDTYYKLAARHQVPMRALMDANNARPPYQLEAGDRIKLPLRKFYTVRKDDTLYAISRRFDANLSDLATLNRIPKPYTISVGQRLQIPDGSAPVRRASTGASQRAKEISSTSTPSRSGRFMTPVKGRVISNFGPKEGGLHNDGINISAPIGTPIKASENGVVVYTGNQLRGYGNLILVRHSGGWVSAYAHTSKFLVQAGDKVKQGEVIAQVGQSGSVSRPQLHFELRKGTRAVDPKSLI
jgi:murein DD-endopeptidase MepM/ murein hydrolase activator NlpD